MILSDLRIEENDTQFIDIDAKINYMIGLGFKQCPDNKNYLQKNDFVIHFVSLYNYNREKMDLINFMADEWFINNPMAAAYTGEFAALTYESIHKMHIDDIMFTYSEAKENFKAMVTFN
jgi:hypothetical protein